jgi:hypothetical protein
MIYCLDHRGPGRPYALDENRLGPIHVSGDRFRLGGDQPIPSSGGVRGHREYRRTREVRDWENSGQFPSAKLGRAAAYESGLEHRFLQLCEVSPDVTWYQEQPLVIQYTCAGTRRDYHPDALVQLADGRRLLAELKHLFKMATALTPQARRRLALVPRPRSRAADHRPGHHPHPAHATDDPPGNSRRVRRPAGPVANAMA